MGLKEEDVQMWDYYMNSLYANLEDQLDDGVEGPLNTLNDRQAILLEEKVLTTHTTYAMHHALGA